MCPSRAALLRRCSRRRRSMRRASRAPLGAAPLESRNRTPKTRRGSKTLRAKKIFFYFFPRPEARGPRPEGIPLPPAPPLSVRHPQRMRLRAAHVDLAELRLLLGAVVLQRLPQPLHVLRAVADARPDH